MPRENMKKGPNGQNIRSGYKKSRPVRSTSGRSPRKRYGYGGRVAAGGSNNNVRGYHPECPGYRACVNSGGTMGSECHCTYFARTTRAMNRGGIVGRRGNKRGRR